MALQNLTVRLIGKRPLLMHNIRLANPMDEHTQALGEYTKKRAKTLADHEMISKLEFEGGIYHDANIGPYVPGAWLDKNIEEGGRGEKLGKTIRASVKCTAEYIPLVYSGPRDVEKLYKNAKFVDRRAVGVGPSRTIRTRPVFDDWSLEVSFFYEDESVNPAALMRAIRRAGSMVGLGDYRPRYGLYDAEEVK
jgi:hypothetical protein